MMPAIRPTSLLSLYAKKHLISLLPLYRFFFGLSKAISSSTKEGTKHLLSLYKEIGKVANAFFCFLVIASTIVTINAFILYNI